MSLIIGLLKKVRNSLRYQRYKKFQRIMSYKKYRGDAVYLGKITLLLKVKIARVLLKVFYVFPIKKHRVFFMAYQGGQYTCNPKYLSEYLVDKDVSKLEIVWAFRNLDDFRFLQKDGITLVKYHSLKYFYYVLTSKVFLYNMRTPEEVPFRRNQIVISTGHGGGAYKKLLLDQQNVTRKDRQMIGYSTKNTDIFISTCKAYTHYVIRGGYKFKGEVMEVGMPRNDELVNKDFSRGVFVRDFYEIEDDVRIVLYAPTYRKGRRVARDYDLDTKHLLEACEKRFGGKWIVMYRLHHFIQSKWTNQLETRGIIDATNYPCMQELLMAADMLITDYSSSIWDYSFTEKPCLLYTTDLIEYEKIQDFYTPIREWPFKISLNNHELIHNVLHFNEEEYRENVQKHYSSLVNMETGKATELIAQRILSECGLEGGTL